MLQNIHSLLEVHVTDQEDARRRKLLNIILLGTAVLSVIVLMLTGISGLLNHSGSLAEVIPIYVTGFGIILLTGGTYAINRYLSGWLASLIFLVLFTLALPFTDVPIEVAAGRTLFAFTVPIIMASVLLPPYSTFLFAALGSLEISLLAFSIGEVPNSPAIIGFFMIALISWLSARSLESALHELMLINRELDKRVADRTQALSEALVREKAEAGRNQAILRDIADGVMVFDNSGRVIVTNTALETLVNRHAGAIQGSTLDEWLSQPELTPKDREALLTFFKDPLSVEEKLKVQWGKRTLLVNLAPVRIAGGETIGQVAVFHDFTREAEVDRMKSDFVAMVSHELRTPLNSILGYVDMLREGVYGKLENRQIGIVERVMANTHKLLSIVNDLLDQAQIEAGRLSFHNRHFRPVEITDYLRGVMDGIIQAKNLEFSIRITDDLPKMLYGDPQRLSQVLINLVNNAVKFTELGSISVRLYRYDQENWAMEVADTGIGIPQESQRFIFEPFRQGDMEVTRRPSGIGLGLSIVKRMVSMMQGDICVNSQVGQGSTFTVILPLDGDMNEKEK